MYEVEKLGSKNYGMFLLCDDIIGNVFIMFVVGYEMIVNVFYFMFIEMVIYLVI